MAKDGGALPVPEDAALPYRLPPLNTLRLFEAAGRHASFKLAAAELNLTPSAVSHGIRTLEDALGVDLFARTPRGLRLTAAGAAYLPAVRDALETIGRATDALPGRRQPREIVVSAAPTFGARWLMPNLHRFSARHPHIDVRLQTSQRAMPLTRDGVDVAIRMGGGDWPTLSATRLVEERLVPVCAPALASSIQRAGDLAHHTLLHVTTVKEDWAAWASAAGVGGLDLRRGLSFDTIDLAMRAAAEGLGVAIGRLPLIDAELADGRLVPVLGPPRASRTGYWLATSRTASFRPDVAAFASWLVAELAETAGPDRLHRPV